MAIVKMANGDFVTHVYNDPKLIAEAEKKGFSLVVESSDNKKPKGRRREVTGSNESETTETQKVEAGAV